MSILHVYSQTVADGTATSVIRPSDWNSNHKLVYNLSGDTLGSSQLSGADITLVGSGVTLSADTAASKLVFMGDGAVSQFPEFPLPYSSSSLASGTSGAGSTTAAMYVNPMILNRGIDFVKAEYLMSHGALSAGTGSCTVGWHLGIYTLNGGTAMSLLTSYSAAAYISQNSATAQTVFSYWGSDSTATNATARTSGNISAAFMSAGLRDIKLVDDTTQSLSAGTYYLAQCVTMRSSSVNIGASLMTGMYAPGITNHAYLAQSTMAGGIGRFIGSVTSQITGAAGNTLSMSMPVSIHTSAITVSASNAGRWVQPRFYR